MPLLDVALQAAKACKIPMDKIFILEMPGFAKKTPLKFVTISDLITKGKTLPELEALRWVKGQGARQPAYLCYSSGTSGLPVSS